MGYFWRSRDFVPEANQIQLSDKSRTRRSRFVVIVMRSFGLRVCELNETRSDAAGVGWLPAADNCVSISDFARQSCDNCVQSPFARPARVHSATNKLVVVESRESTGCLASLFALQNCFVAAFIH